MRRYCEEENKENNLDQFSLLIYSSFSVSGSVNPQAATSSNTRWPTATRRPTDTRWPTKPTHTRWPTATRRPTESRWPTITRRATDTRWPTKTISPIDTRWPTLFRPTDTRWPTTPRASSLTPTATPSSTSSPTITPSYTPSATATQPLWPLAVVYVNSNDVLNVRSGPGASYPIVGSLGYSATGVIRSGPTRQVGSSIWYQVQNPLGGLGWVNSYYLTEHVQSSLFCADVRISSLISQLKQAVNSSNGTLLASLVSPVHGLDIRYWHYASAVHYTSTQAATAFTSTTQQNWGSGPSGLPTTGTFSGIVQPALIDVLNASYESYCNNPHSASMFAEPWPSVYKNFNYFSLFKPGTPGVDLDYRQWMVAFEYVDGQPYIETMIHVIWEP